MVIESATTTAPALNSPYLLHADDKDDIRKMISIIVKTKDKNITINDANHAQEAIQKLRALHAAKPTLLKENGLIIISDNDMPGGNAIELFQFLDKWIQDGTLPANKLKLIGFSGTPEELKTAIDQCPQIKNQVYYKLFTKGTDGLSVRNEVLSSFPASPVPA